MVPNFFSVYQSYVFIKGQYFVSYKLVYKSKLLDYKKKNSHSILKCPFKKQQINKNNNIW